MASTPPTREKRTTKLPNEHTAGPLYPEQYAAFCERMKLAYIAIRSDHAQYVNLYEGYGHLFTTFLKLQNILLAPPSSQDMTDLLLACIQLATVSMCVAFECISDMTADDILSAG